MLTVIREIQHGEWFTTIEKYPSGKYRVQTSSPKSLRHLSSIVDTYHQAKKKASQHRRELES